MKTLFILSTLAIGLVSFTITPTSTSGEVIDTSETIGLADTTKKKKTLKERFNKTKRNIQKTAAGEIAPKEEGKTGLTISEEGVEEGKEVKKKKEKK